MKQWHWNTLSYIQKQDSENAMTGGREARKVQYIRGIQQDTIKTVSHWESQP